MKKLIIILLLSIPILGITQTHKLTVVSRAEFTVGEDLTFIEKEVFEFTIVVDKPYVKVYDNKKYFGRIVKSEEQKELFIFHVKDTDGAIWKFFIDEENELLSIGSNGKYIMFDIITFTTE